MKTWKKVGLFVLAALLVSAFSWKPQQQAAVWTLEGEESFMVDDIGNGFALSGSDFIADAVLAEGPYKFQIIPGEEPVCLLSAANQNGYTTDEVFMMVLNPGAPFTSFRVISYSAWLQLDDEEFGYYQCWQR